MSSNPEPEIKRYYEEAKKSWELLWITVNMYITSMMMVDCTAWNAG
jgi:hypothetical protein